MLIVTAINRSQHPIRVASVAIQADSLGKGAAWDVHPRPESNLPGIIPPLDSAEAYFMASDLKAVGIDLTRWVRGGVKLGDEQMVWSGPKVLWKDDLLAA